MKILITQETDWITRNPIQPHHLAELLSLRGHEICVIDYELRWMAEKKRWGYCKRQVFENTRKIYPDARVTVIRPGILRVPGLDMLSLLYTHDKEIKRQINEFEPDVIVGFGILNSYLASKAVMNTGIPFVYYWVDVLHRLISTKVFQPIGVCFEKSAVQHSDLVMTINEALRQVVVSLGAHEESTRILRTGIDDKVFTPGPADPELKAKLGLAEDDVVLFFMGWLYSFSGLKEVALQIAKMGNDNIKLIVVGEGDLYQVLQNMQKEYGLQDRLILTGKKPYSEIPALISLADICILSSYPREKIMRDIVPIKLYEYMAMQKPVIATRLRGVQQEFGENKGIVYVDSSEDIVPKALELAAENKIDDLGLKAREFVAGNRWDKITDEFEKILVKAIETKKPRIIM